VLHAPEIIYIQFIGKCSKFVDSKIEFFWAVTPCNVVAAEG